MQEFKSDEVYSNLLENDDNKELLEICLFIYLINKKKKQSICFRQEWSRPDIEVSINNIQNIISGFNMTRRNKNVNEWISFISKNNGKNIQVKVDKFIMVSINPNAENHRKNRTLYIQLD